MDEEGERSLTPVGLHDAAFFLFFSKRRRVDFLHRDMNNRFPVPSKKKLISCFTGDSSVVHAMSSFSVELL